MTHDRRIASRMVEQILRAPKVSPSLRESFLDLADKQDMEGVLDL